MQQDYREMFMLSALPNIHEAVINWRTGGGTKLTPGNRAVINWLVKTGLMNRVNHG